jgi:isopentenyl phosphate kinase
MAIGMAETKIALLTLQQYFIKQLVNAGIPAVSVSPSSLLRMYTQTKDSSSPLDGIEQLSQFSNQIQQHVENGLVPVLHGDVVLDDVQGTNVLSGDVIVEMLSSIFAVPIVYFVTDVSGVYTHAPSEQDEITANGLICDIKVGEELTFEMFGKQENTGGPKFTLVHAHDVTGGLEEKMRNALAIVRNNNQVQVFIMKCNTDDARKVMISGIREEHVRATRIHQ